MRGLAGPTPAPVLGVSVKSAWPALAAVLAFAAAWTGARLYAIHAASSAGVAVPAGEASAPSPSELQPMEPDPTPAIPERLPSFSLHDLSGKPTPIGTWEGRSLVINFWATWCDPCRREIPLLQSLDAGAGRPVTVIGIAVDHADKVAAFARRFAITYPLLIGEQDALDVAGRLGLSTPVFPFTVFTDRRGRIVTLFVGELHRPQADLILGVVADLNEDRMPLAAARQAIADGLGALKPKT
jgi:thiol-disulfide isomerase/thioredoxin